MKRSQRLLFFGQNKDYHCTIDFQMILLMLFNDGVPERTGGVVCCMLILLLANYLGMFLFSPILFKVVILHTLFHASAQAVRYLYYLSSILHFFPAVLINKTKSLFYTTTC